MCIMVSNIIKYFSFTYVAIVQCKFFRFMCWVNFWLATANVPHNKMFLDLQQAATCLTDMDQSPSASALESMKPFLNAIVKSELLKHQDRDVKLLVATCVCEITRITAPEAPYSDDVLKVPSIYPSYLIMLIRIFFFFLDD